MSISRLGFRAEKGGEQMKKVPHWGRSGRENKRLLVGVAASILST